MNFKELRTSLVVQWLRICQNGVGERVCSRGTGDEAPQQAGTLSTHPMLTLPGSATLSHALPPKAGTLSSCSDHSRLSDLIGSLIFL